MGGVVKWVLLVLGVVLVVPLLFALWFRWLDVVYRRLG
jgi:hypothetical protein